VGGAFFSLFIGEVLGACIVGGCVGFAAALGKLAFDSILQRDAPDANRGRSFARFETRFQVSYVLGSFIPVAVKTGAKVGFAILLAVAIFATVSYVIGRLAWAHRTGERQTAATAAAVGIEERFAEVSGEVKGRLAAAPRSVMGRFRGGTGPEPPDGDPTAIDAPAVDPTSVSDQGDAPTALVADADLTPVPAEARTTELFDQDQPDGVDTDPDLAPTSPVAWRPDQPTEVVQPTEVGPDQPTVPTDDRQA
jgi:hypothetical protein